MFIFAQPAAKELESGESTLTALASYFALQGTPTESPNIRKRQHLSLPDGCQVSPASKAADEP